MPDGPAGPDRSGHGRQLGLVLVLAVAGAGSAAVAAVLTWWSAEYLDPLTGSLTISVSGASCVPELIPLALVGLAGLGAALATRGLPRRLVGIVLVLCGAAIAVRSALSIPASPTALVGSLTRPADPVGAAELHPFGPILALLAGALLAAAGVLVGLGWGTRQQLSARYDAPAKASAVAAAAVRGASGDPAVGDTGDWWSALDAGADPTADPAAVNEPINERTTDRSPAVSEQASGGGYHDPNASRPT